jgi:hypothetical protein
LNQAGFTRGYFTGDFSLRERPWIVFKPQVSCIYAVADQRLIIGRMRDHQMTNGTLLALRKRLGDPLLTVLTLMLAILMFVVGPLQAAGIVAAHHFGLAFGLVLMAAVFIVSGIF